MKPRTQQRATTSKKRTHSNRRSTIPSPNKHSLSRPVAVSPTVKTGQTAPSGLSAPSTIFNYPGTALVWAEPFNRIYPKVIPGDIKRATEWFRQVTGREVGEITLHPKLAKLASEVPAGVKVRFIGGCLAFEIWLAPQLQTLKAEQPAQKPATLPEVSRQPPTILSPINRKKSEGDKIKVSVAKESRGRKHIALPLGEIKKLASQGYGAKAIASRLRDDNHQVSYKTIQRLLPSIIQPELKK